MREELHHTCFALRLPLLLLHQLHFPPGCGHIYPNTDIFENTTVFLRFLKEKKCQHGSDFENASVHAGMQRHTGCYAPKDVGQRLEQFCGSAELQAVQIWLKIRSDNVR